MKFQKGDRIRRLKSGGNCGDYMKVGEIYEVASNYTSTTKMPLKGVKTDGWHERYFELVERREYYEIF